MANAPRRVVFDPNVLVSAAITPAGASADVVALIDSGRIVPVVSALLLTELSSVLGRPRFRRYLEIDAALEYVAELGRLAEWFPDQQHPAAVSPDPGDDYLVALTVAAQADALVSGDTDLTTLQIPGVRILSPRALLDAIAAAEG